MNIVLPVCEVAKPWGRSLLPLPFDDLRSEKIGEIWFEPPQCLNQIMIKYIFTSENLSVQVHPSDAQTLAAGLGKNGKEECWLVTDADPGAALGIGFIESVDPEVLRTAALNGSIEQRLKWYQVRRGDFFYIPANTVHAIGSGISLIEVQQNSNITYRLYDYGRPRDLHLDEGIAVAKGEPYDLRNFRRIAVCGTVGLVEGPYFRVDRLHGEPDADLIKAYAGRPLLVVPLDEKLEIADEAVLPGSCGWASSLSDVRVAPSGLALLAQPV